jgi:hypothetical protein
MKMAITGSSGLGGSALVPLRTTGGHEVVRLLRRAPRGKGEVRWEPETRTIDAAALEGIDEVVSDDFPGRLAVEREQAAEPAAKVRETADAALPASTRVLPARLEASGSRFPFPGLEGALRHRLGRTA